jgi:RecA/RadA recombinase
MADFRLRLGACATNLPAVVLVVLLPMVGSLSARALRRRLRHRGAKEAHEPQWSTKLALKSVQFWLLFIARVAAASGTTVIVTHQVAHVVGVGFSKLLSASIFGLAGITSSFGRVIFGFIADRLSSGGLHA